MPPSPDQVRRDERYRHGRGPCQDDIEDWVAAQRPHLTGGRALDVACGTGRYSLWLAELGYEVDAVDISSVALERLTATAATRGLAERIHTLQADLTSWRPPPEHYDLVLVSLYLERTLLPALRAALRPQGLLLYTTFHTDLLRLPGEFNPAYLLQPGELLLTFADWELLAYEERRLPRHGGRRSDCLSSILVRKPEKASVVRPSSPPAAA
ncbi:MAG: methyltransferase domain-containing protein [Anaerolineae bacterium]|nr:methyltransferase domain-containing protein [Anaerolineae bacterium]